MATIFFNLHMIGAIATAATVVLAVGSLIFRKPHKAHSIVIPVIGGWQLITGIGLVATTPGISIARICISGFIYLLVIGSVEALVVKQLRTAKA